MSPRAPIPVPEDIVLGQPLSPYLDPVVRLKPADQQYHATIFGRSGLGKSRFLQALFLQHLSRGHGVCLIEPHHDLSHDNLAYLVEKGYFRRNDALDQLVYLDWGNGGFVPYNCLAGTLAPQTRALHALEAMLRIWPELRRAPAFQTLFLSAMMALIANQMPITALHQILSDAAFRTRCLANVTDPLILQAFDRFGKVSAQTQEAGSALRRAFMLSFHDLTRLTLGQPENSLDIRRMMDEGRSLIINLGNVGDAETRRLLGALLLVQIEQAALSRTDIPQAQRRPWTVLIDEWPSFAATDAAVGTILEQTRKFGLRLYLAAQSPGQIASDRLQAALENCRLNVVFGLGRDSSLQQSREITTLDPDLYRLDPLTGRPKHVSTTEQFENIAQDLQTLSPREAYAKLGTAAPVKVRTLSVHDARPNRRELAQVLAAYRARYQRTREQAEAAISQYQTAADIPMEPAAARTPYTLFGDRHTTDA